MSKLEIIAADSPHKAKVLVDGEPLNHVEKFVLEQGVYDNDGMAKLTIYLSPRLVEASAEGIDPEIVQRNRFGIIPRAHGYDPYNSEARP